MRIKEIYDFLNEKFPVETACGFDNVGLLIGNKNRSVTKVLVALDCTLNVVDEAIKIGAELIVTHHPVIFEPLKKIDCDGKIGKLIENKISVISMHTNLDQGQNGVNDRLCEKIGLKNAETLVASDGYLLKIGKLECEKTAEELAKEFKTLLGGGVRFVDNGKPIKTLAVCSGSGGSFLEDVILSAADAFLTADVKHSVFLEAHEKGIALFDAGHFETEDVVTEPLCQMLKENFKNVEFFTNHYFPVKEI
jgi:dinuclear metal center YbgI/SA1388 family protein